MMLEKLIKLLDENGIIITPDFTIKKGVFYTFYNITNNKIKKQSQFAITIVDDDLLEAYKTKDKIDNLILTFGDNQLDDNILGVTQNGGGSYYDDDLGVRKIKAIYIITSRA